MRASEWMLALNSKTATLKVGATQTELLLYLEIQEFSNQDRGNAACVAPAAQQMDSRTGAKENR